MELRQYQKVLDSEARRLISCGRKRILITAPTGSGKTVLFSHIAAGAERRGRSAWIVVHRRELQDQTYNMLRSAGVDPILVIPGKGASCAESSAGTSNSRMITVYSIQTLSRRLTSLAPPDLVVWDECHHIAAKSWSRVFDHARDAVHLGFSATPCRMDGRGLSEFFTDMLSGPSVGELIGAGYLCDYRYFCPADVDTRGLRKVAGDWNSRELEGRVNKPQITGNAICEYEKRCAGKRAIVFCCGVNHSKQVTEEFNARGIIAAHVDGSTADGERRRTFERFREGSIRVLCNVDIAGEGVDVPGIECAILLRPTASLPLHLQQVGRALRPAEGKVRAIILDHVGNGKRHGLPDDDHEWSLDGLRRSKRDSDGDPGVRICANCLAANPVGTKQCRYCGGEFIPTPREVKQKEGELVELQRREKCLERKSCRSLEDLVSFAVKNNYKNPWWWARRVMEGRGQR